MGRNMGTEVGQIKLGIPSLATGSSIWRMGSEFMNG
jgi:hypothetical protein